MSTAMESPTASLLERVVIGADLSNVALAGFVAWAVVLYGLA